MLSVLFSIKGKCRLLELLKLPYWDISLPDIPCAADTLCSMLLAEI